MNLRLFLIALTLAAALAQAQAAPKVAEKAETYDLPPPPRGVSELSFTDFFKYPVGAGGLIRGEKLKGLDGKRVRLAGYMVHEDRPVPGRLLFAALPLQLNDEHYGLADDLPAGTVFAFDSKASSRTPSYEPGLLLITGVLDLGQREEKDGRISLVRLRLESFSRVSRSTVLRKEARGAEVLARRR